MARDIIFRPSTSRPSQFERALDYEGYDARYVIVTHREAIVAVYDTTASMGPAPWPGFEVPDISTINGIVEDVLAMIGEGGGLAEFEGAELCLWSDSNIAAVIHTSHAIRAVEPPAVEGDRQDRYIVLHEIKSPTKPESAPNSARSKADMTAPRDYEDEGRNLGFNWSQSSRVNQQVANLQACWDELGDSAEDSLFNPDVSSYSPAVRVAFMTSEKDHYQLDVADARKFWDSVAPGVDDATLNNPAFLLGWIKGALELD